MRVIRASLSATCTDYPISSFYDSVKNRIEVTRRRRCAKYDARLKAIEAFRTPTPQLPPVTHDPPVPASHRCARDISVNLSAEPYADEIST